MSDRTGFKSKSELHMPGKPYEDPSGRTSSMSAYAEWTGKRCDSDISFYSVLISEDEVKGAPYNYSKDYRRFAYRDFSLDKVRAGSSISPQGLLKWL
eukprot:CAMPEP_0113710954 /NCGR_PEP_ID=MMETSP0038_2-20120614/30466_1 /TAXON_ID=2898 /ORGANISM="Cryptomonas paramecium" /LENGTH=96 /DNA_ID=CAMNT_0000637113 /DNA_START=413 /DNA_END=700 /DNA_ORIENTATION=+ /assembly_acc=CAM_ASM_000170